MKDDGEVVGFNEVRRAAVALAREIERRAPALATSKWWKEERHGVFLDYNQNAKDRTTCSAYSGALSDLYLTTAIIIKSIRLECTVAEEIQAARETRISS